MSARASTQNAPGVGPDTDPDPGIADRAKHEASEFTDDVRENFWGLLGKYQNMRHGGRTGKAGQTGTVLTVVTLGITIIMGILIYSQVQTSLPAPENSELANASQGATSTFAQAMELAPVIMIVLLAAVVLAVVQRFR